MYPESDVTIKNLTITGFDAPANEGVVNHDSGNGWVIENNTIEKNAAPASWRARTRRSSATASATTASTG